MRNDELVRWVRSLSSEDKSALRSYVGKRLTEIKDEKGIELEGLNVVLGIPEDEWVDKGTWSRALAGDKEATQERVFDPFFQFFFNGSKERMLAKAREHAAAEAVERSIAVSRFRDMAGWRESVEAIRRNNPDFPERWIISAGEQRLSGGHPVPLDEAWLQHQIALMSRHLPR
jgi:hypothetical protein